MNQLCLIDSISNLKVQGIQAISTFPSLSLLPQTPSSPFDTILLEYLTTTLPSADIPPVNYSVTHHTPTHPLVAAKAQHLSPEQLKITHQEFDYMLKLRIVRLSTSNWSSPLHNMVSKKSGDWHPCGNIVLLTDHKPLIFSLATASDKYTRRQILI